MCEGKPAVAQGHPTNYWQETAAEWRRIAIKYIWRDAKWKRIYDKLRARHKRREQGFDEFVEVLIELIEVTDDENRRLRELVERYREAAHNLAQAKLNPPLIGETPNVGVPEYMQAQEYRTRDILVDDLKATKTPKNRSNLYRRIVERARHLLEGRDK